MDESVTAAQNGSEEAFRTLYRATQPPLLRYLRTLVGEDADDVASEAWLQIARDIRTFRGDYDGFKGWATTIARHRAMDHLRRMRRRPADAVPVEQLLDVPSDYDTAVLATDEVATRTALGLINRLPRDQAEAILLRVVVGLDAKAAGKVLGKRAGAVRTAAYRGLRRLAKLLEQNPPPAIPYQARRNPTSTPTGTPTGTPKRTTTNGAKRAGVDRRKKGVTSAAARALKEMT
ncbi:MAG TPA: RNA polymerase sigma factor [Micromonosporaceae bacterium]|nr:RNA polymerase sigma factor [Micromonosporaceae bacterium]